LYRSFPIHPLLLKALTGKSLVHPYFCVKSISYFMKKIFPVVLLISLVACKNKDSNHTNDGKIPPDSPKGMTHSIVGTYPHDTSSYTQGLIIYNGNMYEGTGNYGHSKLKQVDMKTGKARNGCTPMICRNQGIVGGQAQRSSRGQVG